MTVVREIFQRERDRLFAQLEAQGGRGVELAESIDLLDSLLVGWSTVPDALPEGLYGTENHRNEMEIRDAQDVLWVTLHVGGKGDPDTWRDTIERRVRIALGVSYMPPRLGGPGVGDERR